nr:hypothetical protein Iba_chr01aCG0440 [Ipomoea batatas]
MLRPFYRPSNNKVKPSPSPSPSPATTDQRGRMKMMNQQKNHTNMITATRYYNKVPSITTSTAASSVGTRMVNQDHLPKHIAATTTPPEWTPSTVVSRLMRVLISKLHANYISSVLERLRLQYLD